MALPMSQKEYLKRYLSAEPDEPNKKKRRKKVKTSVKVTRSFTIVDDDVDLKSLAPASDKQDDLSNPLMEDETPLVADVIDERPKDEVILEQYRTSNKWKVMDDERPGWSERQRKQSPGSSQGRRARHDSSDSDLSPPRKSVASKQPRRHRESDSDVSPPRRRGRGAQEASDSDLSPPRKGQTESRSSGSSRRQGRGRRRDSSADSESDLSPVRHTSSSKSSSSRRGQGENSRPSKSHSRSEERKNAPFRHDSSDSDSVKPRSKNRATDSVPRSNKLPRRRHDSDSDASPRRRKTSKSPVLDLSPPRRGNNSRGDRKADARGNRSPDRRARHDSDSDLSPPRRGKGTKGETKSGTRGGRSPDRRARHDSDSDLSPPRRGKVTKGETKSGTRGGRSPDRRARHDSDSDLSPPRRGQVKKGDTKSGTRGGRSPDRRARHDSDSDLSPPRRGQVTKRDTKSGTRGGRSPDRRARHDSDSDLSPPRRGQVTKRDTKSGTRGGRSPDRRAEHDSDSDLSPPRRGQVTRGDRNSDRGDKLGKRQGRHDSDSDLSPPRRGINKGDARDNRSLTSPQSRYDAPPDSPPRRQKRRQDSDQDLSPVRRGGTKKGRDSWKPEADISPGRKGSSSRDKGVKRRPDKTLSGTSAGLSDAKSMRRENEEMRRRDATMYSTMADDVSGRNAKTVFRDKSGRTRDLEAEKHKKRVDEAQQAEDDKKFVEWGKGVAQNAQQKKIIQDALHEVDKPLARYRDDRDLDEMLKQQEKEGDPMLQFLKNKRTKAQAALGVKAKPKYKGPPAPPNRFNLMPGYRWDGVDRSNGFEKKAFIRQADKKATKEIAYHWSIEDM